MKLKHILAALGMASAASLTWAHDHDAHGHDTAAIGQAGDASKVNRTISVEMSDAMKFTPSSISVRKGETIRFVVKNQGQLKHEMVLGTQQALAEHAALMKKFPEMEHSDPNMVTVAPGQSGEMVWQFTNAGKVNFACLQPGHYDAGMKGMVNVKAFKPQTAVATEPSATTGDAVMTEGVVRKIDKSLKKITLQHGEIKNLDMPGMTMVFQVKDKALLDKVKVGDAVKFHAEKQGGAIVVTVIQPDR